jgi:uncharacterized RDD family membrane protein YckC
MSDIYKPPEAELEGAHTNQGFAYAGFWIRVVAALLDTLWLMPLTLALGWMIYGATYFQTASLMMGWADFFISYVLPFLLTLAFWTYKAATPGKMILGLRIADAETGEPVSKGRLVGRYLGYFVSMLPLMLGIMWVGWDRRKQGWHDKIARTVVIRKK